MAGALFRMIAGLARDMVISNTFGSTSILVLIVMSGFVISRGKNACVSVIFFSSY